MTPEAPGSLVVLNVRVDATGGWTAQVDRVDPVGEPSAWLRVTWSAQGCTGDWQPVGDGVVCVITPSGVPPSYKRRTYSVGGLEAGSDRLMWRDASPGEGLMLVVLLPHGCVVSDPGQTSRPPVDAKTFRERFCMYWLLTHEEPQVWWRVSKTNVAEAGIGGAIRAFRGMLLDTQISAMPVVVES